MSIFYFYYSAMNLSNIYLQQKIVEKKVVKVITGLSNFNVEDIVRVAKAAEIGGATYIDIAAHPDIVSIVKIITNLPICVSSINPEDLYECVLAGADIVEIGNFDYFYNKNIIFSKNQIFKLAQEIKTLLLLNDTKICVTILHTLLLDQQIQLAIELQNLGIDLIQTEGISTKNRILNLGQSGIFNSMYKASAALSSSYYISNSVNIPIIASSGINALSAPIAISYGASGIGIGGAISSCNNIYEIASYINEIVISLNYMNKSLLRNEFFKMCKLRNASIRTKIY